MNRRPRSVVLIGPESTGKTRLTARLARHYEVPWSREHAREYVDGRARILDASDVEPIARGQMAAEDAARQSAEERDAGLLLHDTDLVSTLVYARHYYADCPGWIEERARQRLADLYLLHHVDVPWLADGAQREQPVRREELFAAFRGTLAALGAETRDILGTWREREVRARAAIDTLLREQLQ